MPGLTATGELSYNGFQFTGGDTRLQIQQIHEQDEAKRTVVCVPTTITVSAIIQADTGTDDSLETIRALLSKQGQALIFTNKGFGDDLVVNATGVAGSLKDVKFGPFPEILSWTPIADDKAVEIVWKCTTYLPPICNSQGIVRQTGIMAFNYGATWSINDRGFTTQTITGYLEIAITRNGRAIPDCADLYRDLLRPGFPADFKRESNFTISQDKRRLDFTITLTQIESKHPWPEYVTNIRANHRTSWSRRGGAMSLRNTFSAEIELTQQANKLRAMTIFLSMALKRIEIARKNGAVLIDHLDIDEDVFGMSGNFSISWRLLKTINVLHAGLWDPVDGNWQRWKQSMSKVFDNRGIAYLGMAPGEDAIIDLCGTANIPWVDPSPRPSPEQSPPARPSLTNKQPPANQSWLDYQNRLVPYREQPTTRQATLQSQEADNAADDMNQSAGFSFPQPQGGTADILQIGGRCRHSIALVGYGRRVGHPVPRPKLAQVGSQTPVEVETVFQEWDEGDHFGVKVYGACWHVAYMLPGSPGTISPKPQLQNG